MGLCLCVFVAVLVCVCVSFLARMYIYVCVCFLVRVCVCVSFCVGKGVWCMYDCERVSTDLGYCIVHFFVIVHGNCFSVFVCMTDDQTKAQANGCKYEKEEELHINLLYRQYCLYLIV